MDRIAWMRALVSALVGGFLIVYAAIVHPANRVVLVVLGLILLGVITFDVLPIRRRRDD